MKAYGGLDGFDQSLISNVPQYEEGAFPEKFKVPEFEKYNGTGCPNFTLGCMSEEWVSM